MTGRNQLANKPINAGAQPADYSNLLRPSREGDQFHYLWAARRLLHMLRPGGALAAVAVEAISKKEAAPGSLVSAGEVVIDLAEYDGDEDLDKASAVRYIQLKHSTRRADRPLNVSAVGPTIQQFALRFAAMDAKYGPDISGRASFHFVANRPVGERLAEAVEDLANGRDGRRQGDVEVLSRYAALPANLVQRFWRSVVIRGREGNRLAQQQGLTQDVANYLPGPDINAPLHLRNLIVERLAPEFEGDPVVRRSHVLGAVGASPTDIFPALNLIEAPSELIARAQEADVVSAISETDVPIIIEAPSGVGKSMLTTRLGELVPGGSVTIVYDCFGSGEYRRTARPRHRPQDALVQMVNELSELGFCDPLLPNGTANATDYFRTFLARLEQAAGVIRFRSPQAKLVLVVDAADNAEMAAREADDEHSFARLLLREILPPDVRLVMLCRPERAHLLRPPPQVRRIALQPFSETETGEHLRRSHPNATLADVGEFHRRTSGNPRVQANALAQGGSLSTTLRELGPRPKTVGKMISDQLTVAMRRVLDDWIAEEDKVHRLCTALAILRPLIPIEVLASVTGLSVGAIESFAVDFFGSRAISVIGGAVQFRDEPVEDWFRQNYRNNPDDVAEFIEIMKPLAASSPYVAAALPALLHEVGRLDELIAMALGGAYLPVENAIQRREIELARLQFALRASLKTGRKAEAAKLAILIGGEAAGDSRHLKLVQENWDLAGRLLDLRAVEELVARRGFEGKWQGAGHAFSAGFLAQKVELLPDARSELRIAFDWLEVWGRLDERQRRLAPITAGEIGAMAWATLRLSGPKVCLKEIGRWSPSEVHYNTVSLIVRRLIDAGEVAEIDGLQGELATTCDLRMGMAIVDELDQVGELACPQLTRALLRKLPRRRYVEQAKAVSRRGRPLSLSSTVGLLIAAAARGVGTRQGVLSKLINHLPDEPAKAWANPWGDCRSGVLAAQVLREHLSGEQFDLPDLADPETRAAFNRGLSDYSGESRKFIARVGTVIAFWRLWVRLRIDGPGAGERPRELLKAAAESVESRDLPADERILIEAEVANLWIKILALVPADAGSASDFLTWLSDRRLSSGQLARVARIAARTPHLHDLAYRVCQKAVRFEGSSTESADSKIAANVACARALLRLDPAEAAAYLQRSIEVASRIGDDAYDRWETILQLGKKATQSIREKPSLAYKLGRCGEVIETYLDDHFSWSETLEVMGGLSARQALTQVSRWRDRSVGRFLQLLPHTLTPLILKGRLDAREGVAFLGFGADWEFVDLFRAALQAARSPDEQARIVKSWIETFRHSGLDAAELEGVKGVAAKFGVVSAELEALTAGGPEQRYYSSTVSGSGLRAKDDRRWGAEEWDAHFGGAVVEDMAALAVVIGAGGYSFRSIDHRSMYWREACLRVAPAKAGQFVEMVLRHPDVPLIETDDFLTALPDGWSSRNAVRTALRKGLGALLERNHREVWVNKHYQRVSVSRIAEACGEDDNWALDIIFRSSAADRRPLTSGEAFQLASLLAMSIDPEEALGVLDFALDLIEAVLEPTDGDGPWSPALETDGEMLDALAGLLGGCLAAPAAAVRWKAAHVVRRLCAIDGSQVLASLVGQVDAGLSSAFGDKRFVAYDQHARLWLLIGIARGALENPEQVAAHKDFLIRQSDGSCDHLLFRHFAQVALQALQAADAMSLPPAVDEQVRKVNRPSLPPVVSNRYDTPRQGGAGRDWKERRFRFGYDFDKYWVEPLAVVFNLTMGTVADMAETLVCDEWGFVSEEGWHRDARRDAGILESRAGSRSEMPRSDDVNFYLSFHALMTIAGRLLSSTPAHVDADGTSRFDDWLAQHVLSRSDGRWLADRRDPVPPDVRDGWRGSDNEGWRWSVTTAEMQHAFDAGGDEFVVAGSWTNASSGGRHETVVRSALVSRETSEALMAAMQTVANARDIYLPEAENQNELGDAGFELKGWVTTPYLSKRLDEYDPWSGDIRYPPRQPSDDLVRTLGLLRTDENRTWIFQGSPAFRIETWGSGRDSEGYAQDEGDRILASKAALPAMLTELDKDLIVSVEVEHNLPSRLNYRQKDEVDYADPYFKIFLVKADGTVCTI